jgi:UPF0755 protein
MSLPDNYEPPGPGRRRGRRSDDERTIEDEFWGHLASSSDRGGRTARRARRRASAARDGDGLALGRDVAEPDDPFRGPSRPGRRWPAGRGRAELGADRPGARPPPERAVDRRPPGGREAYGALGYGVGRRSGVAEDLRRRRRLGPDRGDVPTFAARAAHGDAGPRRPSSGNAPGQVYDDVYGDPYGDDAYHDDVYDDAYGDVYGDEADGGAGDDGLDRRRGCRAGLVVLLVAAVVVAGAGFFAWRWVQQQIDPPGPPGETVIIDVPSGATTARIGDELAARGVITNATVWQWYTRVNTVPSIQAGQYELQLNSSFTEAIDVLEAGPLPPEVETVTVPEGLTLTQTVARLVDPERGVEGFTEDAVEAAMADPAIRSSYLPDGQESVEGTLFPETYRIEDDDDEAATVARMASHFDEVMDDLDARARAEELGLSPYEVVIVASMVEKETRVDDERGRVARVIYNRLERGEPLGIDATSCYEKGEIPCRLTTEELESSAYSTRREPGLPPTAIASPGRASLEAALDPADGPWLFYVFDADADDGSHVFTDDYDEFQRAKQRCEDAGICG